MDVLISYQYFTKIKGITLRGWDRTEYIGSISNFNKEGTQRSTIRSISEGSSRDHPRSQNKIWIGLLLMKILGVLLKAYFSDSRLVTEDLRWVASLGAKSFEEPMDILKFCSCTGVRCSGYAIGFSNCIWS